MKSKKVLFLLRLVFFFLLFYSLWYLLSPAYNQILAPVTVQVLKLSEVGGRHITVSSEVEREEIFIFPVGSQGNRELSVRVEGKLVHFDMVLLFALIWAVPHMSWKKRVKIFLLGFAIIFALHQLKMFVYVKRVYSLNIRVGDAFYWSPFQQKAYHYAANFLVMVSNQVFPVLIWSLLYVKYWWGKGLRLGTQ